MNKRTMTVIAVTVVVTLIVAPKLRQLPVVSKLPTL